MTLPKKIIRGVTPPVVFKLYRKVRPQKNGNQEKRTIQKIEETGPKMLSLCFGVPVFYVPVEKLRYDGGVPYNEECHHFLNYYRHGKKALVDFYTFHQPKNVFEKHFLPVPENYYSKYDNKKIKKANSNKPWLYDVNNQDFNGEKGLGNEHGNQAYGPVTEQKIELEAQRLDGVLRSISMHGFQPLQFDGYPRGYFLMDTNGEWTFLVRTGFHRVAALVHLGYTHIPFEFQRNFPRLIEVADCSEWASVKEGYLSRQEAIDIFMTYMD